MDPQTRNRVVEQLDALQKEAAARLGKEHEPVSEHVDALRSLVKEPARLDAARDSASGLRERLLAWEAEHPELTSLASRIVRALEDSGL